MVVVVVAAVENESGRFGEVCGVLFGIVVEKGRGRDRTMSLLPNKIETLRTRVVGLFFMES